MIEDRMLRGGHYAAEVEEPGAYRARRRRVQERIGEGGVAVLLGAGDARGYGDVGSFRQDPDFFYLTGVELPNAALILQADHEMLLLPARRPSLEAWTGPKLGPAQEAADILGFEVVHCMEASEIVVDARRRVLPAFEGRLAGLLASGGPLWVRLPGGVSGELTREQRLVATLRERLAELRGARPLRHACRAALAQGLPGEVALMRTAVDATVAAMRAAAAAVRAGSPRGRSLRVRRTRRCVPQGPRAGRSRRSSAQVRPAASCTTTPTPACSATASWSSSTSARGTATTAAT